MEGVNVPYLPTALWLMAGATTILVLLVALGHYIYWRRRVAAIIGDARDVATLATKKQTLEVDVNALRQWMNDQKAELDRLTAEREEQERLRALLADLENQCATKDQENQGLRKEVGELENRRHELTMTCDKLEKQTGDLATRLTELERETGSKRAEAEATEKCLADIKGKLEAANEAVRGLAEAQAKMQALAAEKVSLEQIVEGHRSSAEVARKEAEQQKQEAEKNRLAAEEAKRDLGEAQKDKYELGIAVEGLRQQQSDIGHDVNRLKERHDTLKAATQTASEEAEKANEVTIKARAEAAKAEAELPRIVRERQALEIVISDLIVRKAILEREVVGLEEKLGSPPGHGEDDAYADLLKDPARCLERSLLPSRELPYADEEHALEEIWMGLEGAGYHFHKRVLKAFHTSLKCHDINPLTVLAGVSGTGKTLLPAAYARLMGMHSLVIAVQPRWDSPQDMFGFYNYLEKRYKATELARALIRMDPFTTVEGLRKEQKCSERMLLILLDEMNLARTEYYFSEFLSKLELRRLAGPSHSAEDRQHAEIYLDTGPGRKPISFWVGQNVLFAGTMNEDESTQTLSDKVIDRANVLRFGRPAKSNADRQHQDQDGTLPAPAGYLPAEKWESWCRPIQTTGWTGKAIEWVDALNDALTKIGRPFGHRVRRSILTYVANYPGVDRIDHLFKEAFADQIEQKILPKLRGLDTMEGVNNAVFDDIGRVIEGTDDDTLLKAFGDARESNATSMFLWHGVTREE